MKKSKYTLISISVGSLIAISALILIYLTTHYRYTPILPSVIETDKTLKIAIIGAGVSGLTAAHTLKKLGYGNVTVFERESKPGGKVFSYEYNGHFYELGAVYFDSLYYKTFLGLLEDFGADYADWSGTMGAFNMSGKWSFRRDNMKTFANVPESFRNTIINTKDTKGSVYKWNKLQLLSAFLHWKWFFLKHKHTLITIPGFYSTFSEMHATFNDFSVTPHL